MSDPARGLRPLDQVRCNGHPGDSMLPHTRFVRSGGPCEVCGAGIERSNIDAIEALLRAQLKKAVE